MLVGVRYLSVGCYLLFMRKKDNLLDDYHSISKRKTLSVCENATPPMGCGVGGGVLG